MKIQILGVGNFGSLLVQHFLKFGQEVYAWDIRFRSGTSPEEISITRLGGHLGIASTPDVVIYAMFPEQIQLMHVSFVGKDGRKPLIVNVSSVQQPGIDSLVSYDKKSILSLHTLFGPQTIIDDSSWKGQRMIVTLEPEDDERATAVLNTFAERGVNITRMSPREHDENMLPHALAFLIGALVEEGVMDANLGFLTSSAKQMLGLLKFTQCQSPELTKLVLANPVLKGVVPRLKRVLEELSAKHAW